jgi:hypothetical protein
VGIYPIYWSTFYLVLFHDWLEGRGESSAMVSGYKFCRTERFEDFEDQTERIEEKERKIIFKQPTK